MHYILIDGVRHPLTFEVRSFNEADCDRDQYLVVVKVRERLVVSKRGTQ
jgi:hypothetical protein